LLRKESSPLDSLIALSAKAIEEADLKETVKSFQVPLTSKLITSATLLGIVVWFVGFIVVCANFLQ